MSLGSIKDYTPNFNFIIPEFNITGWHDYLEENFRSIDALFYNIFDINGYSGEWKRLTSYTTGQVVFIRDTQNPDYLGKMYKILDDHITPDTPFDEFYAEHPEYYERFLDASSAQLYAKYCKLYAEGTDEELAEEDIGVEHSCKTWETLCSNLVNTLLNKKYAKGVDYNNDILNLLDENGNVISQTMIQTSTTTSYNNINNCIVKLPQHIFVIKNSNDKIEVLQNSTVYVNNGIYTFINNVELELNNSYEDGKYYLVWNKALNKLEIINENSIFTGSLPGTDYPNPNENDVWLGSTYTNEVSFYKYINNSWQFYDISLPLCVLQVTNNECNFINNSKNEYIIFNSAGYVKDTIFILPHIKAIIPTLNSYQGINSTIIETIQTTQPMISYMTPNISQSIWLRSNGRFYNSYTQPESFVNSYTDLVKSNQTIQFCKQTNEHYVWYNNNFSEVLGVRLIDCVTDGTIFTDFVIRKETYLVTNEDLDNILGHYYTKTEIDDKIGNIGLILDNINGEIV